MSAPRVSVVVPVFNGAGTLAETLRSVLTQTWCDFELLVIDDGSTDASPAIARGLGDPRIQVHSFENRGLAASRNRGTALARGEYVAFLDADDLWLPDKLAAQLSALAARPTAALAYSFTDCIDAAGRPLGAGSHIEAAGQVYRQLLVWNFLDNGSSALVRTTALRASGGFDETLPAAEDWDLWLRLAWQHEFACVPRADVRYRIHGQAMSSAITRQEAACLRVFATAVQRLPPGPERDRLEREGAANLASYFVQRALTAGGPEAARLAARYWWRFARLTPSCWAVRARLLKLLARILLAAVAPPAVAAGLQRWRAGRR